MKDSARPEVLEVRGVFHKLHDVSMKEIIGVGSKDDSIIGVKLLCIIRFSSVINSRDICFEFELFVNAPIFRIEKKQDLKVAE